MTSLSKKGSKFSKIPSQIEEHDWESYLIDTDSEAAPACNFKQSLIPPTNEFNLGEKLESIDPRNQEAWCIGTIIAKAGPRIRIRLDGTDDRNDFWRLVDAADIRPYGTTERLGGHIVPPLGFQQTSTRWMKYFEKNVKNGPFADSSSFKPQPNKPEKNLFKKGQKLEAVDPRHTHLICPATVNNVIPGDHRIVISLDGWSSSNNFKIDYTSRDIFPVGWCKSAGIRIGKIGGHPPRISNKSLPNHSLQPASTTNEKNNISEIPLTKIECVEIQQTPIQNLKKEDPIVTVYWNYMGDNSGMLLNSQKFHSSMLSIFGPSDCYSVLKNILDCCIRCSFQPTSFINRIRDLFSSSNQTTKTNSIREILLEDGTSLHIPLIENEDKFWEIIHLFQNSILAGIDLFISTLPSSDSNIHIKEQISPLDQTLKRKHNESHSKNKRFRINEKSTMKKKAVHHSESSSDDLKLKTTNSNDSMNISSNGISYPPERFTPSDVAKFVKKIDPSFHNLASRFLQEEIDGAALLLLTTDTLMRYLGLKLGPSLKIIDQIEKLKAKETF